MNGRRKPFRSRWAGRPDTFAVINHHGTKLTSREIASIIDPVRECFAQIRAGTATELHATVMHSTIQVAQEIERGGIVHGLAEHFDSTQAACEAYFARCRTGSAWHASTVHFYELDALAAAIDLHEFQLQQLTAHEIQEVTRRLIARTESSGGEMLQADSELVTTRPSSRAERRHLHDRHTPTGAIEGVQISAVSHEGLSVSINGKPGHLAIITEDGLVIAAGKD